VVDVLGLEDFVPHVTSRDENQSLVARFLELCRADLVDR
jgi:hypothetical protein